MLGPRLTFLSYSLTPSNYSEPDVHCRSESVQVFEKLFGNAGISDDIYN